MQSSFLFEDLPSIEGYKPPLSKVETLLGLESRTVQVGGRGMIHFGVGDDDDDEPRYETRYTITVCGVKIEADVGRTYDENSISIHDDRFTIVVKTVNGFLKNKTNKDRHPEAWKFLVDNTTALNNSRRYWSAVDHLQEVRGVEDQIAVLQRKVARAKFVAALKAAEVLAERTFTQPEREQKWAELSGGLPYRSEE